MTRVDRTRTAALVPLFEERTALRAVVDAVLEGRVGHADADDAERPRVARLSLGCYAIFGGDAASPAARELVAGVQAPRELLHPQEQAWAALLRDVHGSRLTARPMRAFDASHLDRRHLEAQAAPPDGFRLRRFDAELAARLDDGLIPHALQVFDDAGHFAAEGVGIGALSGDTLACVATSYAICHDRIELAIATRPEFRRHGLARAVAARLMLDCLERDLVPEWSAANPVSQHLAVTLGYRPAGRIEIDFLEERVEVHRRRS